MSNQHINIISAFTKIGSRIQLSHGPWNLGSTHSKACDICEFLMSSISLTVYRITNFVKIPVHWSPRLLLITEIVEGCSPWGCKASIASCQAIADHVAGQFPVASNQKRQYNKHISTLQLQSLDPGRILQSCIFHPKNTHKKVKAPVWGGNFYGITKLEHLWIQNLISKKQLKLESEMRQWMSSSPQNLQTRGHHLSPFVTIWSNPWYFYLENQLCLSASTTFVSFDGRGTQQALKIVWRSPPWFPESLAGFWCLETIQERRSLWSPAKKKQTTRFT